MSAAFYACQGVNFVTDDGVDAGENGTRSCAQNQIKRLWRRNQKIARLAGVSTPFTCRCIASAQVHNRAAHVTIGGLRKSTDAGQRRAEISVDVVGKRFERLYIQNADARSGVFG